MCLNFLIHYSIVTAITATVIDNSNQKFNFRWKDTWDFIGKLEFESLYPDRKSNNNIDDYIIYTSRGVPFVISGGDSDYRMLRLVPLERSNISSDLSTFQLVLVVKTKDENFEIMGVYSGKTDLILDGPYHWFQKLEK